MDHKSRILKKISPNEKVVLYLRARDYGSILEPVDGAVVVDVPYLAGRKVFGQLVAFIRYGREKDEVMGLKFYRHFILHSKQIYPPVNGREELTELQLALEEKLKDTKIHPFVFHFPREAPFSVTLFSMDESDPVKTCGIHYFVKVFVSENEGDIARKRNSAQLYVRRIQCIPETVNNNPLHRIVEKSFAICQGNIELEATVDKSTFGNYEEIPVHVCVQNNSNKVVRKIRVSLLQNVRLQMIQTGEYKRFIDERIYEKGCPILPGSSLQAIISVKPTLTQKRMKDGIALNGTCKYEDYDLAWSTFLHNSPVKDTFGIIVNYFVRVKLYFGKLNGQIFVDLPVIIAPLRR